MKLTIGMAVYNDYSGVYFTVESIRMYHNLTDCEIIIVDNYGDKVLEDWVNYWQKGVARYVRCDITGTTQSRQMVFDEAKGEYVMCIDSHVLLMPGAIDTIPDTNNLMHGPMLYDDLKTCSTHMNNEWRGNMWGTWSEAVRPCDLPKEPFQIPMHGLGLFCCKKSAWVGFNPDFRGFGGEEGYIHEKFRQAGKDVWCVPSMKWVHRFQNGTGYPLHFQDRIRNYLLGFNELGMDTKPIYEHFGISMVKKIALSINR